jgi:hypothetical protein
VGFSQFKQFYQEDLEENAQLQGGKIGKGAFLTMIASPYQHAFTPENIKKSFEKTGTWPIDHSQITAEMTAPSVGISGKSTPIISLNSPVKHAVQLFDDLSALRSQFHIAEAKSHQPSPYSLDSSLPGSSAPSPSPSPIHSLFNGLKGTRAAFLFDGSPPSSGHAIPALDFHLPTPPKPSSKPKSASELARMTKSAVIDYTLTLLVDIELLVNHNDATTKLIHPMVAQLALMALENQTLRSGLFLKEKKKITCQGQLFPGGRGKNATSNEFMSEQALLESEAAQKQADLARKREETAARKKIWEGQKVTYQKRRMECAAAGIPMTRAGPPPLLKNIVLGISTAQSDGLFSGAENMLNSRKGKARQHRNSIDSFWVDDLDPEDVESDTESEPWSAQDESDE